MTTLKDPNSLLNVFRIYLADLLYGAKDHYGRVVLGGEGSRERRWYKLTHTFADDGGTSYLDLLRTSTLPPLYAWCASSRHADTFPPFPLVIDYCQFFLTADDQTGRILAFSHCDRVRRLRLQTSSASMKELIVLGTLIVSASTFVP